MIGMKQLSVRLLVLNRLQMQPIYAIRSLTCCKVERRGCECAFGQFFGIVRCGNGVQIHDTKQILCRNNNRSLVLRRLLGNIFVLKVDPLSNHTYSRIKVVLGALDET